MTLQELKDLDKRNTEEGRHDRDFGFTFVARSARGIGVRPVVLAEREDGTKVYMVTVKQLRRMISKAETLS